MVSWRDKLPILLLALLVCGCCSEPEDSGYISPDGFETAFEWVSVPAGEFLFGEHSAVTGLDYDYQMLKFEVTNAQYVRFLQAAFDDTLITVGDTMVYGFYSGDSRWPAGNVPFARINRSDCRIAFTKGRFLIRRGYPYHPVVWVTWYGAQAFASYYGASLPVAEEWEKAARGGSRSCYPWGDMLDPARANYRDNGDPFDNGTTPVGFFNGQTQRGFTTIDSPSPYGAYDMAGNVWEWINSFAGSSSYRTIRSGSFALSPDYLRVTYYSLHFPNEMDPSYGFRIVRP